MAERLYEALVVKRNYPYVGGIRGRAVALKKRGAPGSEILIIVPKPCPLEGSDPVNCYIEPIGELSGEIGGLKPSLSTTHFVVGINSPKCNGCPLAGNECTIYNSKLPTAQPSVLE